MRVHVYAAGLGQARTQVVDPGTRLREVVDLDDGEQVYVVEADDDGEEDGATPTGADLDASVASLFGSGSGHLAIHACRKVTVSVSYPGGEQVVEVRPAARLRRVRRKAILAFGISPADAADLVLRMPGSDQDLDLTLPVAAIVPRRSCESAVDMVHTVRAQG